MRPLRFYCIYILQRTEGQPERDSKRQHHQVSLRLGVLLVWWWSGVFVRRVHLQSIRFDMCVVAQATEEQGRHRSTVTVIESAVFRKAQSLHFINSPPHIAVHPSGSLVISSRPGQHIPKVIRAFPATPIS
ncbi:unnamed protein product [Nippostrongylus brasiliensis]|uniref:Secreted protein n=1 Tax=Nippostrongylus brasiliensis TaxID=27835 RepID=A0A0N4XNB4_NIPBR|nr:unnamed protein product [Nippostrongylus brasiliensis]